MSGSQKALKILSIITIVLAAISIVFGISALAVGGIGLGMAETAAGSSTEGYAVIGMVAFALAAVLLVSGIIDLIVGILGLRGAKDPSKIGPFYVVAIIGLVFAILGLLTSVTQLSAGLNALSIVSDCIRVALMIACVYLANDIKKIRDGRK